MFRPGRASGGEPIIRRQAPAKLFLIVGLAFVSAVLAAACSDRGPGPASTGVPGTPDRGQLDAAGVLARAQEAIDRAGGYRVEMTGQNFVLPRWGGVDGAAIDAGKGGATARGLLQRTGDGSYEVILADQQTFFRRHTCDTWARIPGGGPDVLAPFLWARTTALRRATNVKLVDPPPGAGSLVVRATIDGIGEVTLDVDATTFLPARLAREQSPNAAAMQWTFSRWGQPPAVAKPSANRDNGPGGNPC